MNLEEYISKYIDGTLTAGEDEQLRAYLSENSAGREEFDHAALISVAMMRDAEDIQTPDDLYEQTETLVLSQMRQFSMNEMVVNRSEKKRANKKVLVATLLILAALISDPSRIHKSFTTGASDTERFSSLVTPLNVNPSILNMVRTPLHSSSDVMLHVSSDPGAFTSTVPDRIAEETEVNQSPGLQDRISVESQAQNSEMSSLNNSFIEYQKNNTSLIASTGTGTGSGTGLNSVISVETGDDIQLSTFMGTIVTTSGSMASRRHYSQSLAYKVSDNDNVGVEVGTFSTNTVIPEQFGSSQSIISEDGSKSGKGTLNGSGDVESDSRESLNGQSDTRLPNGSEIRERNLVWGAAFFERSFVHNDYLNLKARVAVGSSSDGPVVFARTFTSVNVYGPLSFNLGAEGRMFLVDDANHSSTDQNLQTMLSMMYGIQVKF